MVRVRGSRRRWWLYCRYGAGHGVCKGIKGAVVAVLQVMGRESKKKQALILSPCCRLREGSVHT